MEKNNIKDNNIKDLLLNQKGMALLTTLIFIFILVSFGVALLSMTSNDIKLSALQRDSTKAFYVAESGIEKALWYLNTNFLKGGKGFGWRTDDLELYPEGYIQETYPAESTNYYQVTVKDTADPEDIIIITSRGVVFDGNKVYGNRKIEVKAIKGILPSDNLFYEYAIATDTSMVLQGNINITGNIHSNGTIGVAGETYVLDGYSSAVDSNDAVGKDGLNPSGPEYYDEHPQVDFNFYKNLSLDPIYGGHFYDIQGATKYFNTDGEILTGIHFIDGDVVIKSNLTIIGGAIFATGTITSTGNAFITHTRRTDNIDTDCGDTYSWVPGEECYDPLCNNPFALVAKGNITLGGTIHTEGIIQTEAEFTSNGNINVDPGAIYADEGVFHGGGGVMNVVYEESLIGTTIVGTGLPYYIKISWQEV